MLGFHRYAVASSAPGTRKDLGALKLPRKIIIILTKLIEAMIIVSIVIP